MNEENRKILIKNIIYILDKKTDEKIKIDSLECIKNSSRYSNTKIAIYKLKINGNIVNRNNSYRIFYKCITCNNNHLVNLNNIVRKINRNIFKCHICANNELIKTQEHSNYMKNYHNLPKIIPKKEKKISIQYLINVSKKSFDEMDENFKNAYFSKHMTKEEFNRIKHLIISINNGKIKNLNNYEYISNYKINNQTYFNPFLYNKKEDILEKIIYIKYKCEKCELEFINRDLYIQKNKYKIYCKDCNFCNKTFKIRKSKNILNQSLTYQSKLELKFIMNCNKKGIIINNGPKIEYFFKNKYRKYIVDFYIPASKTLIELKDNHIWHKKQVENGMWKAKIDSVNKLLKDKQYSDYKLIFPNELTNFIVNLSNK